MITSSISITAVDDYFINTKISAVDDYFNNTDISSR